MELNHLVMPVEEMRGQMAAHLTYQHTRSLVIRAAERAVEDLSDVSKQLELATAVAVYKVARREYEKALGRP